MIRLCNFEIKQMYVSGLVHLLYRPVFLPQAMGTHMFLFPVLLPGQYIFFKCINHWHKYGSDIHLTKGMQNINL